MKKHFVSDGVPAGMRVMAIAAIVSICIFYFDLPHAPLAGLIFCWPFHALSAAVFLLTVAYTREQRLTLAFSSDDPRFVIETGPYRYLRHPFYFAYILFWAGCVMAVRSPEMALAAVMMTTIYVVAARREERKFDKSPYASEYTRYSKQAGFLWPKL